MRKTKYIYICDRCGWDQEDSETATWSSVIPTAPPPSTPLTISAVLRTVQRLVVSLQGQAQFPEGENQ